jgi:hypothetical protein
MATLALERERRHEAALNPQHDAHVRMYRAPMSSRKREAALRATPRGRLDNLMRVSINKALRGLKAGREWESLVGYSLYQLRDHFERQFCAGMTWENRGRWEIDHILPRSTFSYTSADDPDFRACWALANIRPLWAQHNRKRRKQPVQPKGTPDK